MGVLTQAARATNHRLFCLTGSKNAFNKENGGPGGTEVPVGLRPLEDWVLLMGM